MSYRRLGRPAASPEGWIFALLLILSLGFLDFSAAAAEGVPESRGTAASATDGEPALALPDGKVVFHKSGDPQKQIYILGQNHRSAVTGGNGDKTLEAQVEIYRIGEWLIRQRQVELLLPEGFFGELARDGQKRGLPLAATGGERLLLDSPDHASLREKLADSGTFTNAAILLNADYGVPFRQVEDRGLYGAVADSFRQLTRREGTPDADLYSRLSCFQERRSAAMLQNIPAAVEREFQSGNIGSKQAVFIIGMAHIAEILHFLEAESITLTPSREDLVRSMPCELALLKENYGVTVILPRSLAEDAEVMRLTKLLDKVPE